MSDEIDFDNASGGELRKKLEETLDGLKQKDEVIAEFQVKDFLHSNPEFAGLPVDDLKGVSPEDLPTRAAELQEQRVEQEAKVARDLLSRQGLEGDELESAVLRLVGSSTTTVDGETQQAFERVGALTGGLPTPVSDESKLHGKDAITAALTKNEARRSK